MAKKIDMHCHILPETWPQLEEKYGYGGWVQLDHSCEGSDANMMKCGKFFRRVQKNCWDVQERLEEMEKTGVKMQVISTVPVMFSYWAKPEDTLDFCEFLNNDISDKVRNNPENFIGMGTLPMQDPHLAAKEVKRCSNNLGIKCFQIGTSINDKTLDLPEFDVFYKSIVDNDCSIFVHPWDMKMDGRMSKYWLPWLVGMPAETSMAICSMIFGGVFDRYPKLKVCFAHGGGSFPYTTGRIQHGYDVRPDLCNINNVKDPNYYLGKFYCDSLVHNEDALDLLISTIGGDKIMLGSDYPFPLGEHVPGEMIEKSNRFDSELKNKLLFKNALEFFNIKE